MIVLEPKYRLNQSELVTVPIYPVLRSIFFNHFSTIAFQMKIKMLLFSIFSMWNSLTMMVLKTVEMSKTASIQLWGKNPFLNQPFFYCAKSKTNKKQTIFYIHRFSHAWLWCEISEHHLRTKKYESKTSCWLLISMCGFCWCWRNNTI